MAAAAPFFVLTRLVWTTALVGTGSFVHGFPRTSWVVYAVGPFCGSLPENEAGVKQSVFLDDRILIGSSVKQVLRGFWLWKQWSRRLGFENESEIVVLAQNGYQRHAFIRAGFQEHQVQSQIRILGVDLLAATCVDQGNAGSARIDESLKFAQRLARVPLPLNVRTNLCRTRIIPKVSWGWLFRDLGFRI